MSVSSMLLCVVTLSTGTSDYSDELLEMIDDPGVTGSHKIDKWVGTEGHPYIYGKGIYLY